MQTFSAMEEDMEIKISEFAAKYGVSDRHVRRLVAANADILGDHIDKRANCAFLDDFAQDFLLGNLRDAKEILPAEDLVPIDAQTHAKLFELAEQQTKLSLALADAERRASQNAAAAGLLAASNADRERLSADRDKLIKENSLLEAQNRVLSIESEKKDKTITELEESKKIASDVARGLKETLFEKEAEHASEKSDLLRQIEEMKKASLWQRIRGWKA